MNSRLLREKLLELKMTPELLAVKIGRSSSTVYNMLAGKVVGEKTLYRTASVIGVRLQDLSRAKDLKAG